MKKILIILIPTVFALVTTACKSNPNKPEKITTKLEKSEDIGNGEALGANDKGEMVVQRKVRLASYLKDLQSEVYNLEAFVYGDEDLGRKGLYGVLRDCRDQSRAKEHGGDGKVSPPPKKDIRTKGEDTSITELLEKIKSDGAGSKVGLDEQKQLVAIGEDYLLDRIKRFESYKDSYSERKDWFAEEIRKCKAELKEKEPDIVAEAKSMEVAQSNPSDRDLYLCNYVDTGASLKDLVTVATQRGWLNKNTLAAASTVNSAQAKDGTGFQRDNILKLGGWSLAFDSAVNFGEMMNQGADAKLEAWMHVDKNLVAGSSKCLTRENGWWNNQRAF